MAPWYQRVQAWALRQVFDHIVLGKPGYDVPASDCGREELRSIPTRQGEVSALFHWPEAHQGLLPVYAYLHGGGFVFGRARHEAVFCRRVAAQAHCLVVNIDYARAPQWPFPTALQQCYDAVAWIASNAPALGLDARRIAVGGTSAGGNLTAGICAMAKQDGGPAICLQVLDNPALDLARDPRQKRARIAKPLLTPALCELFNACYVPRAADRSVPLASPLQATAAELADQPPALVITAEYDLLRDEGDAYAEKLREAGVQVHHEVFSGVDHFFTHTGPSQPAEAAWQLIHGALRQAFQQAGVCES